jgi:hypothetical protein
MTETQSLARAVFRCSLCQAEAGVIDLMQDAAGHMKVVRVCFTSKLEGRVEPGDLAAVREAIDSADVRRLHQIDDEYASFYCPKCDEIFCRAHWQVWDVFDSDGWHDSIRGCCPQGHERRLED